MKFLFETFFILMAYNEQKTSNTKRTMYLKPKPYNTRDSGDSERDIEK